MPDGNQHRAYLIQRQAVAPALAALMSSKIWDRVEQKIQCLDAVVRADVDAEKRYLLTNVIDIYMNLDEDEDERFRQELDTGKHTEVKKMVLTLQEAIAASEARGRSIGEVEEARKAVLLVAEHRWGTLPDDFVSKLANINDLDRLHLLMEQALKATSPDSLGF